MAGQVVAKEPSSATYRIAGVVVDAATGAAVAGAELTTGGDVVLKTVADNDGRFVFTEVEEGKYPLYATAAGYVTQGYNQHGGFFTGIAVGKEVDSEHLLFRLPKQAVIWGRVTDERGDGVRQAAVMLFAENRQQGRRGVSQQMQTQTNDQGEYRFAHLLPGKYYVGVIGRPWYAENRLRYQPRQPGETGGERVEVNSGALPSDSMLDVVYPVTYFAGATESEGAVPLIAKPGDAIEANVRLIAMPSIHVLLTNVDNRKRHGQNASVFAVARPFNATTMPLNANAMEISPGVFEVAGLPPGEVRLTINRGGDEGWDALGIRVHVADGETVDANAKTATSSVSGVVVPPDGSKEEMQGEVVLRQTPDEGKSARLRKDGTFTIPGVEEGTYEVSVGTQGAGDYVAKLTGTGAKVAGQSVKIEGAGEVRLLITMGRGWGQMTGVVKLEGKPLAGVMVLLVPATEDLPEAEKEELTRMDQSDSDGTFALSGIVPGKYVLMAIEDGWELEWRDDTALKKYREKGVQLDFTAGQQKKMTVEGMKRETKAENGK
jgi:hypothetical protein